MWPQNQDSQDACSWLPLQTPQASLRIGFFRGWYQSLVGYDVRDRIRFLSASYKISELARGSSPTCFEEARHHPRNNQKKRSYYHYCNAQTQYHYYYYYFTMTMTITITLALTLTLAFASSVTISITITIMAIRAITSIMTAMTRILQSPP